MIDQPQTNPLDTNEGLAFTVPPEAKAGLIPETTPGLAELTPQLLRAAVLRLGPHWGETDLEIAVRQELGERVRVYVGKDAMERGDISCGVLGSEPLEDDEAAKIFSEINGLVELGFIRRDKAWRFRAVRPDSMSKIPLVQALRVIDLDGRSKREKASHRNNRSHSSFAARRRRKRR